MSQQGSKGGEGKPPTPTPTPPPITKGGEGQFGGKGPSGGVQNPSSFGGAGHYTGTSFGRPVDNGPVVSVKQDDRPNAPKDISVVFKENLGLADSSISGSVGVPYELPPTAKSDQKRESNYGGVVTPQSRDRSFGWSNQAGKSQKIGDKIFSNQVSFQKGPEVKPSPEKTSFSSTQTFVTFSESLPINDQLGGNAKGKSFGGSTSFISKDVSGELAKGNAVEVFGPSDRIFPAHSNEPLGIAFGPSGTKQFAILMSKADKQDYFLTRTKKENPQGSFQIENPQAQKEILQSVQKNPKAYEKQSNNYWENLGRKGYLNSQGIEKVNDIFHVYERGQNKSVRESQKQSSSFIAEVNARNDPFYNFNIIDKNGKIVSTTTGQRSYYDFMKSQGYGNKSKTILGPYQDRKIEAHFSNTPEAASKRYDLIPISPSQGIEAYGSDVKSPTPQLGGLQAISRTFESIGGGIGAGLESAFVHGSKQIPSDWWKSGSLDKPIRTFGTDVFHSFIPISLTSLSKGKIESRNVELTPEAATLQNRTSAPNILGVLMGKEPVSPNVSKEYYDVQAAFYGYMFFEGLKPLNPLHIDTNPLLLAKSGSSQVKPAYRGLTLGYGEYKTELIGQNPEGKTIFGRPTLEQQAPKGYRVVAREQEGSEVANKGNVYSITRSTNPKLLNYLSETGRSVQSNVGDIMKAIEEKNRVSVSMGHTEAQRPFKAGITTDETAGKGLIKGIVQNQSFWSRFKPQKGGQGGEVYGSGLTFAGGSNAAVATLKKFGFEQKDVEQSINPFLGLNKQAKGEAITKSVYEKMLQEQGVYFNPITKSYETPRGPENLPPEQQELYAKQQIGELKYEIAKSTSERGNYVGGSTAIQLQFGKKGFRKVGDIDIYVPISKFKFFDNRKISNEAKIQGNILRSFYQKHGKNPTDVIVTIYDKDPLGTGRRFVKITDKSTGKSILEIVPRAKPSRGIIKEDKVIDFLGIQQRKANQIIRDKSIMVKSLEKKQASGKKLSAFQQKKLTKAKADIVSARNAEKISTAEMVQSGLLKDYLRTRLEGTKIYSYGKSISGKDIAEGGKIYEIPQLDKDVIASQGEKGESIFNYKIDKSTHKYPSIVGKPIKVASQVFNKATQEKKQATINTKESLSQQGGVTSEHYNILGEKFFLGEAVYSGGKALARGSVLELDDALKLMNNPETKAQGIAHLKNIDLVGKSQSWFYGIDWNDFITTYFQEANKPIPQEIKPNQSYYQYVNQMSGGKPISAFKPTKTSRDISGEGPSSYPGNRYNKGFLVKPTKTSLVFSSKNIQQSQKSNRSQSSLFNGKSSLSNNYSVFSGKSIVSSKSNKSGLSEKSSLSSKSGLSDFYGVSSKSNKSGFSGKSGISELSGFSGVSSLSGSSGYSGLSGLSGVSSISGLSGISGISGKSSSSGRSGSSALSGSSLTGITTTSIPPHKTSLPWGGNFGRRRKAKGKEGPTALYKLNVNNIFSSNLSIIEPRSKRFEF